MASQWCAVECAALGSYRQKNTDGLASRRRFFQLIRNGTNFFGEAKTTPNHSGNPPLGEVRFAFPDECGLCVTPLPVRNTASMQLIVFDP